MTVAGRRGWPSSVVEGPGLVGQHDRDAVADRIGELGGAADELLALGIAVAIRCDDCIGFHVKAALQQGATREEIMETLGMAIYMGAGPAVMYASHAIDAFDQFETPATAPAA